MEAIGTEICEGSKSRLAEPSRMILKKVKKARSLSPPSGALHKIGSQRMRCRLLEPG
jgi:hypothetical protein